MKRESSFVRLARLWEEDPMIWIWTMATIGIGFALGVLAGIRLR